MANKYIGVYAPINPSVGFPMEMGAFPDKTWVVSHKTAAVAAGLRQMGIHCNVIHPKFGSGSWLGFIGKDQGILIPLLLRKIRLKGRIRLLKAFARCFPS